MRDANLRKMRFRGVSLKTSFTKAKLGANGKQPKSFKTGFSRPPLPPLKLHFELSYFMGKGVDIFLVLHRKFVHFFDRVVYLLNS